MGLVSLLFSFRGRVNRSQYWAGSLGVCGANVAVMLMTSFSSAATAMANKADPGAAIGAALGGIGLIFLVNAVTTWCALAIQVKRFHDRGRTGWFSAIPFVLMIWLLGAFFNAIGAKGDVLAALQAPLLLFFLVGLAFLVDLGCLPGQSYSNKHGDPPGSSGYRPQPTPAPGAALAGAQTALDRAIAERPKTATAYQGAPASPAPPRAPAGGGAPAFGRRAAR